jgi:hypothetical protein
MGEELPPVEACTTAGRHSDDAIAAAQAEAHPPGWKPNWMAPEKARRTRFLAAAGLLVLAIIELVTPDPDYLWAAGFLVSSALNVVWALRTKVPPPR